MPKVLFKGARVLSLNDAVGDWDYADVLVDGPVIAEVGNSLDGRNAEIFDASGMLLMPGMVDSHTHLWQSLFRGRPTEGWGSEFFEVIPQFGSWMSPDDVFAAVYAGAVEMISVGVTSVLDYFQCALSPEHVDAAVAALQKAGIRALFGYDLLGHDPRGRGALKKWEQRSHDVKRIRDALNKQSGLVQCGVCLSTVTPASMEITKREVQFARELGCRMSHHNNSAGEVVLLHEAGLLGPDILGAHCNYVTKDDVALLASVRGFISTQPEVETHSGRRPMTMVGRAHRAGVRVALGVDCPALVNPGIMTQMRFLYFLQRFIDGIDERLEGHVPLARRPGVPTLSARDVLRFGTVNGAAAIGFEGLAGQIAPGYQADLILLNARTFGMAEGDAAAHVVLNAESRDIDSVMIAGQFRKRAGELIGVDLIDMSESRSMARDRVMRAAGEYGTPPKRTYWNWVSSN